MVTMMLSPASTHTQVTANEDELGFILLVKNLPSTKGKRHRDADDLMSLQIPELQMLIMAFVTLLHRRES